MRPNTFLLGLLREDKSLANRFFGSVIAFTAYSWLLKVVSPALVATYAYVNPVVAVLLGWGLANESITPQMLLGAAVIIGSVALITSQSKH